MLVVDDSLLISNRLKNLLSELEYVKFSGHAENYDDAVILTDALKPHVILLDVNLAVKSGIDVLKHVKKNYPSIRIIMFTNKAEKYYRTLCLDLGADYFLDKTNEFELLTGLLEKIYETAQW